jgi:quinol---cytochrome c reductase iron-sulfur subunit
MSVRSRAIVVSVLVWGLCKAAAARIAHLFVANPEPGAIEAPSGKSGRSADRDLDPRRQKRGHQQWGTLWTGLAFALAVASGGGFLIVYWYFSSSNWLLGVTLALFLGGLGISLVLYSHWLMPAREATEPREELLSSRDEREATLEEFRAGAREIGRRGLLGWIVAAAALFAAAIVVSLFRSLGEPPGPSLLSTVWKRGQRLMTADGTPVSVNALQPGSTMIVFPEDSIGDERAQTVLIRVNPQFLHLPEGRSEWAPLGYLAYSRVCTHAGCAVGLYEATAGLLMCPCHQSTFDVLRGAEPTSGPAARPLPQLPLYADGDGTLRADGGFSQPPGPGFWGMPS